MIFRFDEETPYVCRRDAGTESCPCGWPLKKCKLDHEYAQDWAEYIEEMSLGGEIYERER